MSGGFGGTRLKPPSVLKGAAKPKIGFSIRTPVKADPETRGAAEDTKNAIAAVAKDANTRLADLETLTTKLQDQITALQAQLANTANYVVQPSTEIRGDLRVNGDIMVKGDVKEARQVGGVVKADLGGTTPTIASQCQAVDVVEVHGALKVTSALRADTIYCRKIVVSNGIVNGGQTMNVP